MKLSERATPSKQITIKQHIYPRSGLRRFAQAGQIDVLNLRTGLKKPLSTNAPIFWVNRALDQRTENGKIVARIESEFGVVWWVDEDAFDLPPVKRQQRLEGLQVVTLNEQVVFGRRSVTKNMASSVGRNTCVAVFEATEKAARRSSQSSVGMVYLLKWIQLNQPPVTSVGPASPVLEPTMASKVSRWKSDR